MKHKVKNWICDCPEGWIIPLTQKMCSECKAISPKVSQSISRSEVRRKFWDNLTAKQKQQVLNRLRNR